MPRSNDHQVVVGPDDVVLQPGDSPAFEQQLLLEIQAAYVELGQSSRRFAERIASCCEHGGCSPKLLARVLRDLPSDVWAEPEPDTPSRSQLFSLNQLDLASPKTREPEKDTFAPMALPLLEKSLAVPNGQTSSAPSSNNLGAAELCVTPIATHSRRTLTESFVDVPEQHMREMRSLFAVPKCLFIEAAGDIRNPPSLRERLFYGGSARSFLKPTTGCLMRFVTGLPFKIMGATVILLNFFFIIAQSDYRLWAEITQTGPKEADWMKTMEVVFTVYYVFELSCLMIAYRKDFFVGADMLWNWFDFLIVFTGVLELIMTVIGGTMLNLSFLRVLRFFKMSRVLRMFSALRMVKDVKVMVDALTGSFIIFIFGCVLWAMLLSIFSIFFVQGFATLMEARQDSLTDDLREAIIADFGCVAVAMRSLYMSATGGNDWSQYHDTIKEMGTVYDYLYLFYTAFTLIAFFNVITGVFAEKAMALAAPSAAELTSRRKGQEVKDAQELVDLLKRKLKGKFNGFLSLSDFDELLTNTEVVSFFEVRCLKADTAHRFFKQLLDMHEIDKMDIGRFVSACVKLDGVASSIDLHVVSVEVKTLLMKQALMQDTLNQQFVSVTRAVDRQLHQLQAVAAATHAPLDPVEFEAAPPDAVDFEAPRSASKVGPDPIANSTEGLPLKPTRPMGDLSNEGDFGDDTRGAASWGDDFGTSI